MYYILLNIVELNIVLFYTREEDGSMHQKKNQKRNKKRKKRIEKRNQEEEEEEREVDRGRREQKEEIKRGISNKRYVSSCIIEDKSLTFY